jgi:predicted RND superfamily exporter protein
MEDLGWIFLLSILFVSIVIIFFHRSFKGITIGFVPTAFAIVLTFGTLGIFSPELTTISVAIIALLIGLGVDYSVHIMNRFAEEKYIDDKVERLEKILRSTGKAVLLSTITTMIGFGSLMISSMSPMVSFGFGCAIGIFYAFISAIILVPCFSIILKYEKTGRISSWIKFANFAVNNRKRMVF